VTVAEADAAKTAAAKIPNGTIPAVELENEGGKLIYSYELKVPGHSGIEEATGLTFVSTPAPPQRQ
jgi:uncharacterized membrane protein YkoI